MEEEWRGEAGSRQMVSLGGGYEICLRACRFFTTLLVFACRTPPFL